MNDNSGKFLKCLPILAFFGYWFYACLISALLTGEPRMLELGLVTVPLLAAMAAALVKAIRSSKV